MRSSVGGTEKLSETSRFNRFALRKLMICLFIAILFSSSLSFLPTTQFVSEEKTENETDYIVIDPDQGLPQDPSESTDDTVSQSPSEGRMPRFPSFNREDLGQQDLTDDTQEDNIDQEATQDEPPPNDIGQQMPPGNQVPDDNQGGTVKTIGVAVYSDIGISELLVSLDWGELRPGGTKTVQCYIQNTGDTAEFLALLTDNWSPVSATEYITLSWDYDEQPLNINEVIPVNLTLDVAVNIQGISTFDFDITIIGAAI